MGFLKTLDADSVQNIWAKLDVSLIAKFKEENASLSEADADEEIKDGKLTLKYQTDLNLENLSAEEAEAKLKESDEYLVENFGTQSDIDALNAWKAEN